MQYIIGKKESFTDLNTVLMYPDDFVSEQLVLNNLWCFLSNV